MPALYPKRSSARVVAACLASIDPDTVDAVQVARTLRNNPSAVQPQLDRGRLQCLRTIGVSHVVSQLLLRQAGAAVWLCNTSPVLRRCLEVLRLHITFLLIEA